MARRFFLDTQDDGQGVLREAVRVLFVTRARGFEEDRVGRFLALIGLCALAIAVSCGGDGSGTGGSGGGGGIIPAPPLGCDPIAPSYCGFPYPNDYYTVKDSVTGLRLALPQEIMPVNTAGRTSDPAAFNEADGFSAGIAA